MMQYKAKMPGTVRIQDSIRRVQWCRDQFGPESLFSNYGRWQRYKEYLYFRDEKDYLFYMLRWT